MRSGTEGRQRDRDVSVLWHSVFLQSLLRHADASERGVGGARLIPGESSDANPAAGATPEVC